MKAFLKKLIQHSIRNQQLEENNLLKEKVKTLEGKHLNAQNDYRNNIIQLCRVCHNETQPFQEVYGKFWYHCTNCDFFQAEVSKQLLHNLNKGEGFKAGGGKLGYREYWISKQIHNEVGLSRILLYGTGNTLTFKKLNEEKFDAWGCDISDDLVAYRNKETYGEKFFHARKFPEIQFDLIVTVEVFEHFFEPLKNLANLAKHLKEDGIIAGTTDFYDDTDISDHIYLKPALHIAYWSRKSLEIAAATINCELSLFELQCPGSVIPDEKFGVLWPRKRVFFIYPQKYLHYFKDLSKRYPILPINKT